MDGYEATRRLRRDPRYARLPIIAMTANAMPADLDRSRDMGMNGHVSKPFEPQQLFDTLLRVLEGREAGAAPAAAPMAPRAAAAAAPSLAPPSPRPAPTGPAIDLAQGLRRCLGREDLLRTIMLRYRETRLDDPVRLRDALAARRLTEAGRLLHATVSSAGILGAQELSQLSRRMQQAIDAGDLAALQRDLPAFEAEHGRVLADLGRFLAASSPSPA
jgi:two-component system, sensor histidine kinase and response regulator